jgi:hypothetical protein
MGNSIISDPALVSALLAYYKLDGNALDSHGSNHGTAEKTIVTASGMLRNCIVFDGNGDPPDAQGTCQIINCGSVLNTSASFSISYWAYANGVDPYNCHLSIACWNGGGWQQPGTRLFIQQPNGSYITVTFAYFGSSGNVSVPISAEGGLWTHWVIAVNYNVGTGISTLTIYKNGVRAGTNAGSVGGPSFGPIPLLIGGACYNWGSNYRLHQVNGKIDEVAVFNRALTPLEAIQLYHAGYPYRYDEFYADISGTADATLFDLESLAGLTSGYVFPAATDFEAITGPAQRQISLSWVNPVHPDFLEVTVRRSKTGYPPSIHVGETAYTGTGTGFIDSNLDPDELYYYSIFACDTYRTYSVAVNASAVAKELNRAKLLSAVAIAKDKVRVTWDQELHLGEGDATDALVPANWTFETLAHPVAAQAISTHQLAPTILDITLDEEGTVDADYTAIAAATLQAADLRTISPTDREFEFTGLGEMPQVMFAQSIGLFYAIVQFSEAVLGAEDKANYNIPGLVIASVSVFDPVLYKYQLRTGQQAFAAPYLVEVSGVTDLAGSPIDPAHDTYAFTGFSPESSSAVEPSDLGLIAALTSAIGEACTEMAGLVSTRLSEPVTEGETVFPVESTEGWSDAGRFAVEGIPYTYTGKGTASLTGVKHIRGGEEQNGAAMLHHVEAAVTDIGRNRSYAEKLRRALLLNYAEGEDLNVVGRNFGLIRHPFFTDDAVYREVIRAMAYSPKGTMLGLELGLCGMVGEGNFEIYEDLIRYPCQVFIRLTGDALQAQQTVVGKAWMTELYWDALRTTANQLDLGAAPLSVYGVQLKPLQEVFDFRTLKPSDVTYPYYPGSTPQAAFGYAGTLVEGDSVLVAEGQTKLTCGSVGTIFYRMLDTQGARVTPASDWVVSMLMCIPTGASLKHGELFQAGLSVFDGQYRISCGLEDDLTFGLMATSGGGFLGTTVTLARDTYYAVELRRAWGDVIELRVNGQLVASVARSNFSAAPTTDHQIEFGIRGTPNSGMAFWGKQFMASITAPTDYWSGRGVDGATNDAAPTQLIIGGATHDFLLEDVGKSLRTFGSAVTNARGGNNNGRWRIATYVSATTVTLRGVEQADAETSSAAPTQITVPLFDGLGPFVYPDDLGKQLVISGSHYGNDGVYTISKLFDSNGVDYATTRISGTARSNVCQVTTPTITTEVGLTWELRPAFVDETGLSFEMSGAGSISGTELTLRKSLWKNDLIMEILAIDEHSAQLVDHSAANFVKDEGPPPVFAAYPWYVADPLAMLKPFSDQLTAAGVVPKYYIGDELNGD